jgi:lipopolysaccharide/colanic/teichoic acid biosynthesis glycosyltransferase
MGMMAQSDLPYRIFNRVVDYGFALAVFLLLFWLLTACWIAIRLTSPGPAIFRQTRVGRGGKLFTCYKFRTMRLGARQAATHEMPADAIAPLGRFMRRTKIDELPQILNLLRGEMSLVGPRPCLPSQGELVALRTRLGVLTVRPGITGLAQVQGVDMSDAERLAQLDARYVLLRSVRLDIEIILKTLRGSGSRDYIRS